VRRSKTCRACLVHDGRLATLAGHVDASYVRGVRAKPDIGAPKLVEDLWHSQQTIFMNQTNQ
jgi:hypothetical protein